MGLVLEERFCWYYARVL